MRNTKATLVVVCSAALIWSARANAGAQDTSDTPCGSTQAGWNVDRGWIVLSRGNSSGPIAAVLGAVSEYRTHSMISHGNGAQAGYVTHHTMYTPGTNGWPTYCSTPVKVSDLRDGFPGASQVNQGAIYQYSYGGLGPSGPEYFRYQRGNSDGTNKGAAVADWLWNNVPYEWNSKGFYILKPHGSRSNYSLYQYRNIERSHEGQRAWNNGMMCSSLLAFAQHGAGFGAVSTYTYNHGKIVAAIDALYNSVEHDCEASLGTFLSIGSTVSCFESICDDAARQVSNCMAVGRCDTDTDGSNSYKSVRNDPSSTATSISPDRIGGWSGHPYTGAGVSVWAYDSSNQVQWNSGGNVYGCWF